MKKYFIIILTGLISQSCMISTVKLKSKYQEETVKAKFNRPFEDVWDAVIDFVAESGLSIQMIDKSSGLILSADSYISGLFMTHENQNGKIMNQAAWVVVERTTNDNPTKILKLHDAVGRWNMRVKQVSDDETIVSLLLHVNRVNIVRDQSYLRGVSTGNFEKDILDKLFDKVPE